MKTWYTSKTIWTSIVAIIGALSGYFTGQIGRLDMIQAIFLAVIAIFMRLGMNKPICKGRDR